jgi:hypothetical protein
MKNDVLQVAPPTSDQGGLTPPQIAAEIEVHGWIRCSSVRPTLRLLVKTPDRKFAEAFAERYGRKSYGPYRNAVYPEVWWVSLTVAQTAYLLPELSEHFRCEGHKNLASAVAAMSAEYIRRDELYADLIRSLKAMYATCPLRPASPTASSTDAGMFPGRKERGSFYAPAEVAREIEAFGYVRYSKKRKRCHLAIFTPDRPFAEFMGKRYSRKLYGPYRSENYGTTWAVGFTAAQTHWLMMRVADRFQCEGHRELASLLMCFYYAAGRIKHNVWQNNVRRHLEGKKTRDLKAERDCWHEEIVGKLKSVYQNCSVRAAARMAVSQGNVLAGSFEPAALEREELYVRVGRKDRGRLVAPLEIEVR